MVAARTGILEGLADVLVGQQRTSRRFGAMCAVPPRADKLGGGPFVR